MSQIPEVKISNSGAWALFQAGEAWMAWEVAQELEAVGHPFMARVYRIFAIEQARCALPFLEDLARRGVGQVLHQRMVEIIEGGKP